MSGTSRDWTRDGGPGWFGESEPAEVPRLFDALVSAVTHGDLTEFESLEDVEIATTPTLVVRAGSIGHVRNQNQGE